MFFFFFLSWLGAWDQCLTRLAAGEYHAVRLKRLCHLSFCLICFLFRMLSIYFCFVKLSLTYTIRFSLCRNIKIENWRLATNREDVCGLNMNNTWHLFNSIVLVLWRLQYLLLFPNLVPLTVINLFSCAILKKDQFLWKNWGDVEFLKMATNPGHCCANHGHCVFSSNDCHIGMFHTGYLSIGDVFWSGSIMCVERKQRKYRLLLEHCVFK